MSDLRCAYDEYRNAEVDRYIEATYTAEQFALMVEQEKARLLSHKRFNFQQWGPEAFHQYAEQCVRRGGLTGSRKCALIPSVR